jgi:ferrous iron transport protein B
MIAALLPGERVPLGAKAGIMVGMYALGTVAAFGFAWLFKRTLLKGEPPPMMMELPAYQRPSLKWVVTHMVDRAWSFMRSAGTVILGISIVLWFLSAYPKAPAGATASQQLAQSFAGRAGHALEPAIKPLGFDWQIGIGLISSFAAREVFVSTMGIVFNAESSDKDDTKPLREAMLAARWPDGRPLFTPLVCLTLMIFYVFAMQCASTLAVVKQETGGWKWPLFQTVYLTGTAWIVCFVIYQAGRLLGY